MESEIIQGAPFVSDRCHVQYVVYGVVTSNLSAPLYIHFTAVNSVNGVVEVRVVE